MRAILLLSVFSIFPGCTKYPSSPVAMETSVRDTTPPHAGFKSDEQLAAEAVLEFVLSSPEFQQLRDDYGTPASKEICLQNGEAQWPSGDYPAIATYTVYLGRRMELENGNKHRVLGLRLEELSIKPIESDPAVAATVVDPAVAAELRVTIFNAGGSQNGAITGACNGSFRVSKGDRGWKAHVVELLDP